jgi:hypothetical protein
MNTKDLVVVLFATLLIWAPWAHPLLAQTVHPHSTCVMLGGTGACDTVGSASCAFESSSKGGLCKAQWPCGYCDDTFAPPKKVCIGVPELVTNCIDTGTTYCNSKDIPYYVGNCGLTGTACTCNNFVGTGNSCFATTTNVANPSCN